ncbi:MAG TPA: oligosaccharide flippase family protein [Solirubrobacteraceae bacterium]|nr:oligosaccharide flippase family protein [Solirubrobacteraceae bacterium]
MSSAAPVTPVGADSAGDVLDTSRAGGLALRGSVLRLGGYGGGMLLALVSAPLLIRHLHQADFGHYVTALSIATIATGLTEGGVSMIALREFASRTGDERNSAMRGILGIRLLLSVLGVIAATVFAAAAGYSRTIVLGTAIAGVGLTIQVLQTLLSVPLQGTMRFGWVAAADLLRNGVSTLLIVALVLAGAGIIPLLAVIAPACLAALALTARLVRGSMPLRPSLHFARYAPLFRETFPFAVAIALSSVYYRVTVIVMSLEASALQTGYFSTSFRIVEILISLPVLVIGAAYPIVTRAARDDPDRFAHAIRRMFELSVLVGIWVALALELGAGFPIDVLGGHAAVPAAPVLRIQGLAVMATFVAVACSFPLLSLRRYTALLLANALGLVVTLAVSLSLVPVLQARGAAIATVAAEVTLACVAVVVLVRARPEVRLPWGVIPLALVAGGAGIGVGDLAGVHPVLEVFVGTCVYAIVLAALGRFPPEIGHAIRARHIADGVG